MAGRSLGFITTRTSKQFRLIKFIKLLYYNFVRSKLEYGAVVWSPMYLKYITESKSCYHKMLKFLVCKLEDCYADRSDREFELCDRFNQWVQRNQWVLTNSPTATVTKGMC